MTFALKKYTSLEIYAGLRAKIPQAHACSSVLLLLACLFSAGICQAAEPAAKAVSADEVQALQAKYLQERDAAEKTGAVEKFAPELVRQADALAQKGEADLTAGRLVEARDGFREARWHLPIIPPGLPEHLTRIFGSLKLRHAAPLLALAYSPDGKRLAVLSGDLRGLPADLKLPTEVKIWDTETGRELLTYRRHTLNALAVKSDSKPGIGAVAFSPDGKTIASAGTDKEIRLWEADTGQDIRTLNGHKNTIASLAFSPDGKYLASAGNGGQLLVHNLTNGVAKLKTPAHAGGRIYSVAYSPDGQFLLSGGEDKLVSLWKATSSTPPSLTIQPHSLGGVYQVAFNPDGKSFATCGGDGLAKLHNLDGRELLVFRGHKGPVTCLAFSSDGKLLVTGSLDRTIRLWDVASGQALRTLQGQTDEIISLALRPDGKQIASAGNDQEVRLWDLDTVERFKQFVGHKGPVWSAAFSPDGGKLSRRAPTRPCAFGTSPPAPKCTR